MSPATRNWWNTRRRGVALGAEGFPVAQAEVLPVPLSVCCVAAAESTLAAAGCSGRPAVVVGATGVVVAAAGAEAVVADFAAVDLVVRFAAGLLASLVAGFAAGFPVAFVSPPRAATAFSPCAAKSSYFCSALVANSTTC